MVTKKIIPIAEQKITAWSYSRLDTYLKCPRLAFYKFVLKLKEPGSKAMDRGSAIHKLAERIVKDKPRSKIPEELSCFTEEIRALQKNKTVRVEVQQAFTNKWGFTDWFGESAWCRVVIDLLYIEKGMLYVVDWKTGKLNDSHSGQLSLYALAGLLLYPDLDEVNVQLFYADHGIIMPEEVKIYTQADVPALKKEWAAKAKPILADRRFPPKPGNACQWCHFSKAKGGQCDF